MRLEASIASNLCLESQTPRKLPYREWSVSLNPYENSRWSDYITAAPASHYEYPRVTKYDTEYITEPSITIEDYSRQPYTHRFSNDHPKYHVDAYNNNNNYYNYAVSSGLGYVPTFKANTNVSNMNYSKANHRRSVKDENWSYVSEKDTWYPTKKSYHRGGEDHQVSSADEGFSSWNSSSERICDSFTAIDYQDPDSMMNSDHSNSRSINNNDATFSTGDTGNNGLVLDDTLWHTSAWSAPRKLPRPRVAKNRTTSFSYADFNLSSLTDTTDWCEERAASDVLSCSVNLKNRNDQSSQALSNFNDDRRGVHRVQKVSPYPLSSDIYSNYRVPFTQSSVHTTEKRSSVSSMNKRDYVLDDDDDSDDRGSSRYLIKSRSDSVDNMWQMSADVSPTSTDVYDSASTSFGAWSSVRSTARTNRTDYDLDISSKQESYDVNDCRGQWTCSKPRLDALDPQVIPDLVPKNFASHGDTTFCKSASSSSSSETDVNMVGNSFNNFSISSNKQQEILRLLQERRRYLEANIREVLPKCFQETKILNTNRSTMASSNRNLRRQRHRRSEIAAWDVQVADGLVLERVRYDPGWKRRNRIFCNSGEEVADESVKNPNFPKSVPNEIPRAGIVEIGKPLPVELPSTTSSMSSSSTSSCSTAVPGHPNLRHLATEVPTATVRELRVDDAAPPCELPAAPSVDSRQSEETTDINRNSTFSEPTVDAPKDTVNQAENVESKDQSKNGGKPSTKLVSELFGDFDVYNIETTMPTIDWALMEAHLTRAAKEDDWASMRRNEREEIRRKLALGPEADDYYLGEKVTRKPSLSTRLQSGMNLQICFMNETVSDHESTGSGDDQEDGVGGGDGDGGPESLLLPSPTSTCSSQYSANLIKSKNVDSLSSSSSSVVSNPSSEKEPRSPSSSPKISRSSNGGPTVATRPQRPSFFFAKQRSWRLRSKQKHDQSAADEAAKALKAAKEVEDFYTRQARLQAEARLALAQAKEMARMQMQVEKQQKSKKSPIADIIGLPFSDNSYRISRQLLMNMNISQLQVVVNDLHTQIESLNEELVRLLMSRDDLNMEQDSMLVDIEDLTRFLGANSENGSNQQANGKSKIFLK